MFHNLRSSNKTFREKINRIDIKISNKAFRKKINRIDIEIN